MQKLLKNGIQILIIMVLISLIPVLVLAEGQIPTEKLGVDGLDGIETDTVYQGDTIYSDEASSTFSRWNSTLTTYLIDNHDQTKTIVEANDVKKIITLADYDTDDQLIAEKVIDFELPIFGAFYPGEKYNYIAFGQDNREENSAKEVIRIVRYDKNFNRIDSVSINGGDSFTIVPFAYACGRMSENGNKLVLHSSRLRYTTSDGLNHQSQLTIIIDTQTMAVTNNLSQFQTNHVSHSFDQYVQFDGYDHVLIDHGDAYPRAIVLNKESGTTYSEVTLFDIPGSIGANCTGVSVGGFEISSNNYIVAMNTIDHSKVTQYTSYEMIGLDRDQRNILLCLLPKNSVNSADVKQFTLAKYVDTDKIGSIPKLVKITDDKLMVLWQEFSIIDKYNTQTGDLKYVLIDGNGNRTSDIQSISGFKLGESDPKLINDKVIWCTHEEGRRNFYAIPLSGSPKISVSSFTTDKENEQVAGTPIGLSAKAIGGTGSYQYKFYCKNGSEMSVIQDFSRADSAFFKPETAGTYTLFVDVKDASGQTATKSIENFQILQPEKEISACYTTHVQNAGWQEWIQNGAISGTVGQGLRLEGVRIYLITKFADVGVSYSTHIQNIGWQKPKNSGSISGTTGSGLRLEAIKMNLTGSDADQFDIYYQVHAENFGWLDWAKNGEESGTAGFGYRLEGLRILVVPKGDPAPGLTTRPFVQN